MVKQSWSSTHGSPPSRQHKHQKRADANVKHVPQQQQNKGGRPRVYSLGHTRRVDTRVFLTATFLLHTAVNVMAPNLTEIARSLGLDELQRDTYLGGFMSTAYFLVGAPASLVVGVLTDVCNRKMLFTIVSILSSAVIVLTGIATNIWQMLVLRALLGALLGGIQPLLYSLFGDLFPPNQRAGVSSIVGLTMGGGTLIGQLAAGFMGTTWTWRSPYYFIGVLCVVGSVLLHQYAVEPERGFADEEDSGDADLERRQGSVNKNSASQQSNVTNSESNPVTEENEDECPNTPLSALLPRRGTATSVDSIPNLDLSSTAENAPQSDRTNEDVDASPRPRQRQPASQSPTQVQSPPISKTKSESREHMPKSKGKEEMPEAVAEKQNALDIRTVKKLLNIRTNLLVFLQALPGTIPWGIITVYLHDFFKQEQGFTPTEATIIVMTFAVGAVLGGIGGGIIGQKIYNSQYKTSLPIVIGCFQISACIPVISLINWEPGAIDSSLMATKGTARLLEQSPVYILAILGGLFASSTGPNMKAILLNVNTPSTRGSVFTLMYLFDSVGKGVGPAAVAAGVSLLGGRVICFNIAMLGWVASGLCMIAIYFTMTADEAEARARIRASG